MIKTFRPVLIKLTMNWNPKCPNRVNFWSLELDYLVLAQGKEMINQLIIKIREFHKKVVYLIVKLQMFFDKNQDSRKFLKSK